MHHVLPCPVTAAEATHGPVSLCRHPTSSRNPHENAPHRCHRSPALLHVSPRETGRPFSERSPHLPQLRCPAAPPSWRTCRRRSVTACLRRRIIVMLALVPPLSARCVSPAPLLPGALYHPWPDVCQAALAGRPRPGQSATRPFAQLMSATPAKATYSVLYHDVARSRAQVNPWSDIPSASTPPFSFL
ncbi:hypothetical protein FKP32DRAFT_1232444 [Trametes sanguinea]|nr:hypothetical protein FKP32DRAFT_1232444 [Trametes sanguinea]